MAIITVSFAGLTPTEIEDLQKAFAKEAGKDFADVTAKNIADILTAQVSGNMYTKGQQDAEAIAKAALNTWDADHPNFPDVKPATVES